LHLDAGDLYPKRHGLAAKFHDRDLRYEAFVAYGISRATDSNIVRIHR
jgi:hypothetical protein